MCKVQVSLSCRWSGRGDRECDTVDTLNSALSNPVIEAVPGDLAKVNEAERTRSGSVANLRINQLFRRNDLGQ